MKPTDSKNKSNYRKKTDSRKKPEVWQNSDTPVMPAAELPDLPVVSKLRRVVDVAAMQPARPKKQENTKSSARKTHKNQTPETETGQGGRKSAPDGKGSAWRKRRPDKFVPNPPKTDENTAEILSEERGDEVTNEPVVQVQNVASENIENISDVVPQIVKSENCHAPGDTKTRKFGGKKNRFFKSVQKTSHERIKTENTSPESASPVEDKIPEAQNACHTEPIDVSENLNKSREVVPRKIRTAKAIKPKIHALEKNTTARKDRLTKSSRLLARHHHGHDAETRRLDVSELVESVMASLMLESWRARQWMMNIFSLDSNISDMIKRCMPMVQARFVNNICIDGGRLEATVVEHVVSVGLRQFTQGQWRAVVNGLSDRAIFTTSLLNGELPEGILDVFKQASLSLFPTKQKEFHFYCDCGSEQMPCEHVCALLLEFAQALEEDPFHILALRGMTRENLLAFLRDARSDQVVDEKTRHRINYELPAQNVDFESFCEPKGDFEDLKFHIAYEPNTLVRRLGNPSVWHGPMSLEAAVMPIIELAAREAENLGIGEQYFIPVSYGERNLQNNSQGGSRAPKSSTRAPRFKMPDMSFVLSALPQEILETVPDDPVVTAEDIIRWLKTRGASDIRTLARRTRLHKPTIEAFLNAFCDAGLTDRDGEGEKIRFFATF